MNILVLGIFVADAAFRCDRMPAVGETRIGTGFTLGPGGKGSNQAVAAARAGGTVGLISRLGQDTFADMAEEVWRAAGVTPLVTRDAEHPTGAAGIFVEEGTGRNAIVVSPGAAGQLSVADVEARAGAIAGAKVAMTQLEQPITTAQRFLEIAAAAGVITVLNPAPAAEIGDDLLALCDYLTPNETEAEALTGLPVTTLAEAEAAARALMARGVRKGVIVTLGDQGAYLWDGVQGARIPPVHAGPTLDTTGAGDAFNGGFATALAEGQGLPDALRFASAVAGLSVTRIGTAAAMPDRAEVQALLAR